MFKGSHLQTSEAFQYGRFECMMQPAFGSGIISSFFLFSDASGFQNNWQEIDFEYLGKNTNSLQTNLIKTIGGTTDKNVHVINTTLNKRSEDVMWKLSIEWSPASVTWKVNDITIRISYISFNLPMKLMMNIWTGFPVWSGELNTGLLPQTAKYEYVRVSKYVNGRYILAWQEDFSSLSLNRWQIGGWTMGNTQLIKENVTISNSILSLKLSA